MRRSLFKQLFGWLGWTVMAAILGIVSFVLVAVRQGWEFNAVLSGSMEPVYHVGSLVVFRPVDPQTVQVGDIVSFKLPALKTPICHRVIDIVRDGRSLYFQTKGDANEEPDQDRVLPEYVKGEGILHVPYLGRLADLSRWGRTRIDFLGRGFPAAALVIAAMGLLFVGLTLKETAEDILWPAKRVRRDMLKRQESLVLNRRRAFRAR
jgi:signal peptidase I